MPPSLHETRKVPYRWLAQGDLPEVDIPLVADLPWLPDTYLEGLRDDRPMVHGKVDVDDEDVQRLRTEGEPCRAVWKALEQYQEMTQVEGKACHDSMCIVQFRLLRLGEQEHEGVDAAMDALYEQFEADRGDQRDTATEFSDAQFSAVSKILANPTPEDRKGCCTPLVPVKTIDYWLGVHEGAVLVAVVADKAPAVPAETLAKWLGERS
jgi:hypothetical protein